MTLRLRKITFVVHVDECDEDGNVTGEGAIAADQQGAPHVAYPHQLDGLAARIRTLVASNQPDTEAPA